jgi:hypothetical protein
MPSHLASGETLNAFSVFDLDESGTFLHPVTQDPVQVENLPAFFQRNIRLAAEVTDIVVFVHGWNNTGKQAEESAARLFSGIEESIASSAPRYPELTGYHGHYIAIRWPSRSLPTPGGYRNIRDRAHKMTTGGCAEFVLAALLGYLNIVRRVPVVGPPTLRTRSGQYLHLVGHSFGGRFITEAVKVAANPQAPPTLALPARNPRYPYTVDDILVFQMAAKPDAFTEILAPILYDSPVHGPIALTFAKRDMANCRWHRLIEGSPGIGCGGASMPPATMTTLRPLNEGYDPSELDHQLINVDASWLYRDGPRVAQGAHSDFWYPESIHLLLSLAAMARRR